MVWSEFESMPLAYAHLVLILLFLVTPQEAHLGVIISHMTCFSKWIEEGGNHSTAARCPDPSSKFDPSRVLWNGVQRRRKT